MLPYSCDIETTFCMQAMPNETTRGDYSCVCNFGYYIPNQTHQFFDGQKVEEGNGNFTCIPCPINCQTCDGSGDCYPTDQEFISMETLLRVSIGAVLSLCLLCCFVLAAIVFRQRKCRVSYFYSILHAMEIKFSVVLFSRQFPVVCGLC